VANPDKGAAKLLTPLAAPAHYFELDFQAQAGVPYRLWLRGRAEKNSYSNDSVYVQFSDSVDGAGASRFRIATTSGTVYTLEDCSGCGVAGWGWNDNYYGTAIGDLIYFAATGTHTIRIQVREDGLSLDQIVLSPVTYFTTAPGAAKNDTVILAESGTVSAAAPPPVEPTPTPVEPTPEPTPTVPPTPAPAPGEVALYAATAAAYGNWTVMADSTAAGGYRLANADRKAAKLNQPLATPVDYFELTFSANAATPYRLWIRGNAAKNSYLNDSVFIQFSDSVTVTGAASYRIGTKASAVYSLEDCSNCGVAGWGWNDTVYGPSPSEPIYFAASGQHTIRIQVREDGLSIDQIVLSPGAYLTTAPGAAKNDSVVLTATDGTTSGTPTEPPPPVANLAPVLEPGEDGFRIGSLEGAVNAPATILFTASATGPESTDTLTYTWDFGDGSAPQSYVQNAEASRQNAVHTYVTGGVYTATVTIADQAGNTTQMSGVVTVAPGALPDPAATLKVVQWNVYKGRSTDTRTEQSKIWLQARWIAAANPDVVLLQEVMGSTMAEKFKAELERLLPQTTWTYFFRSDAGTASSTAEGVAILTRRTIQSTASLAFTPCPAAAIVQRSAIAATVSINGRSIAIVNTHLSSYTSEADMACRSAQAQQLVPWAQSLGPVSIVGGDLNADPLEDAMAVHVLPFYADPWEDTARRTAYPDNPVATMVTRSERIDYVLTSQGAPLELVGVQVPDTRDVTNDNPIATQGQTLFAPHNYAPRASDHELLISTFLVR
jgi:endonuclease/exonuclease/phosphatase family metal-dependent hydrolase